MKKISMVGNTHFDPVWLWTWDEAMSSITATFRAALERMKEYDDFTYSFSAPAVLEWIEKTDSELFEEIKKRINEGRWELCEGWWLQADCNCASGESYIRQGLYAQKYHEKNFGKRSKTVFNIDSFGHCASLPQILAGCGIENYVFWRPNEEHKPLKTPLFWWEGANDSFIKTYRIGGDGGEIFTADITKNTLEPLIQDSYKLPHDLLVVYGVTDHGGAPTIEMINKIKETAAKNKDEFDIHFGTVEEFFDAVDMDAVPTVKDELQVKFIGPFSNVSEIKKNNRKCEYAIMNAEKAAVIAEHLLGCEYSKDKITECWKDIMFNQFHDILGGCCIEDAYFDARNLHGRVLQNANEIIHYNLQSITNKIKMPGKNPDNAWNLVVWNLNGFDIDTEIEAEVQWAWEFGWYNGAISLEDADGNEIPCQIIAEKPVLPKFRSRFVFKAKIPSLGYKSFIVRQKEAPHDKIECNVDYDKSGIVSYKSKPVITEFMIPYVVRDICDTWGFNKTVYEDEKEFLKLKEFKQTEDGFIRKSYRLIWEYNKSTVEQIISVYQNHVDCKYRVLWNEKGYALKFLVSNEQKMNCTASIPYGEITRELSEYEKPMVEWVKLWDENEKIVVASDSVSAYNFDGVNLGITVLRNCLYGDLRTEELDTSRDNAYMGQGVTEGMLRVFFNGNESKESAILNNPPVIKCEANHDGIFAPENRFFANTSENVIMTTLKKEEDGNGYVLRMVNSKSQTEEDELKLFDKSAKYSVNPEEIQTIISYGDGFKKTNMLEE